MNLLIVLFGKVFLKAIKFLNLGNGSTWPGHIALAINKNFVKSFLKKSKIKVILIAGTNGKTTTGKLTAHLLNSAGKTTIENDSGANLLNGLASTLIKGGDLSGKLHKDYLIFEADENALSQVLKQLDPDYLICLNLFRDQLDRYGEIDSIAKKWKEALDRLDKSTTLVLNADDPQIAYLGHGLKCKTLYFGLSEKTTQTKTTHGADSIFCPKCNEKLTYTSVFFSHLGVWECKNCKLKRPKLNTQDLKAYPLLGTYNKYNTLASYLIASSENLKVSTIIEALTTFKPAFGRQEKLSFMGKDVQIFLSKNPTSFNESLDTIKNINGKNLLILLNDQIPDGLDISWIWDINFETILGKDLNICVSGDRAWEMGLRLKHANIFTHIEEDYGKALTAMAENLNTSETLFILANYSAMLNIRKAITGKKIL